MESKFLICLTILCLLGTAFTAPAPAPTYIVLGTGAASALTGALLVKKAALLGGLLGAKLARGKK